MSLVVSATEKPSPGPVPVPVPFRRSTQLWHGVDGTTWDLGDVTSGVLLGRGVKGLYLPPIDRQVQTYAGLPGARFKSSRTAQRDVEWPITIFSDTSSENFLDIQSRFFQSLSPDVPGTWEVIDPLGRSRTLQLRLSGDGEYAPDLDPFITGASGMLLEFVADQPYWQGAEVSQQWAAPVQYLFFGGGDPSNPTDVANQAGPPFVPSQSTSLTDATITNPGNVPAWLTETVVGPCDSITVTVNGGQIGFGAIASGSTLVINTAPSGPNARTAFLDGVEVSGQVIPWDPRPLPPGVAVPVEIVVTGAPQAVSVSFVPQYYRAF